MSVAMNIDDDNNDNVKKTISLTNILETEVIIHPLVLLSVTDHYNRVAKDTRKRVVGVLLGNYYNYYNIIIIIMLLLFNYSLLLLLILS